MALLSGAMKVILRDVAGGLALSFISLLLGLGINAFRANPLPLVYQTKTERFQAELLNTGISLKRPLQAIPEISLKDLRILMKSPGLILLDARSVSFYQRGHLPGAHNVARGSFPKDLERLADKLNDPNAKAFVIYCSEQDCDDSLLVAGALTQIGFQPVSIFKGGWEGWEAAGLSAEKGGGEGEVRMEGNVLKKSEHPVGDVIREMWIFLFAWLQLVLGGIFVWAGVTKMPNPLAFADSIASFKILPLILINPLALSLPPLEIVTGLILIGTIGVRRLLTDQGAMNRAPTSPSDDGSYTRRLRRLGAFSVIVLCSIFCLAILSALVRGIPVDCGCFGSDVTSAMKTWLALGRDALLGMMSVAMYRHELARGENSAAPILLPPRGWTR